jgi:enoyl-CoA hydratase
MASEKSQTQVQLTKTGDVANIQFTTAGGVNIFSTRVVNALGELVQQVAKDSAIRFVVLRGQDKIFLAGADISEMSGFDEDAARTFATNGHRVFDAIEALPQVTVAAINGHALGGGLELALTCDFRIMVATAKIGPPETRLGLIPGWGGTLRLPRVVGLPWARRLIFSGDSITGEQAHEIGLADKTVPSAELLDAAVMDWLKMLAPGSPAAIANAKRSLQTGDEIAAFARCFTGPQAKEGTTAFLGKKAPSWADWAPPT